MHQFELYGCDREGKWFLIDSFNATDEFYFDLMGGIARAEKADRKFKRFRLLSMDWHGQISYGYEINALGIERGKIVK